MIEETEFTEISYKEKDETFVWFKKKILLSKAMAIFKEEYGEMPEVGAYSGGRPICGPVAKEDEEG